MFKRIWMVLFLAVTVARSADWPHWGGGLGRNMVNPVEKNMPESWDVKTGENVKWVMPVGSLAYGNPVVADGRVLVGTNNEGRYDPAVEDDRGEPGACRSILPRESMR